MTEQKDDKEPRVAASSTADAARGIVESPGKLLNPAFGFIDRSQFAGELMRDLTRQLNQMGSIQQFLRQSEALNEMTRSARLISLIGQDFSQALRPTADMIAIISGRLSEAMRPLRDMQASTAAWDQIAEQMRSLQTAWAFQGHFNDSVLGFVGLRELNLAIRSAQPFVPSLSELVNEELGTGVEVGVDATAFDRDKAAIEAGLNPELIAFPSESYGEVLLAAGFKIRLAGPPVPRVVEPASSDGSFDPAHSFLLTEVEQRLRQLVQQRLSQIGGERWIKRRVSETVRKRWQARLEEERAANRPVFELVQYSDFMDLVDVISQKNNWEEVFLLIFQSRDDFVVSLQRLHPIRKAIAHARPIGRADVLTLISEATRILGALGVKILH